MSEFSNEISFSRNFPTGRKLPPKTSQRIHVICAPSRWVTKVQLLKRCHTSDYWDRSMSTKWTQKRKPIHAHEFTEFSLVLILVYLAIKVSDIDSVTKSQTTALIVWTSQRYVCNLVLFHVAVWRCNLCGFYQLKPWHQLYHFSTIVVAGHVHSRGFAGNIGQTWLSFRSCCPSWSRCRQSRRILSASVQPQECVSSDEMSQILGHSL